jgi:hypothetical protein
MRASAPMFERIGVVRTTGFEQPSNPLALFAPAR